MISLSRTGLFVVLFCFAVGCTRTHQIRFTLPAENKAAVLVLGESPFVVVDSQGPSSVIVRFEADEVAGDRERTIRDAALRLRPRSM